MALDGLLPVNPAWPLQVRPPSPPTAAGPGLEAWDGVPEGRRNDTLFRMAAKLRGEGASDEAVWRYLQATNQAIIQPPLDGQELQLMARQVCRYPVGELTPKGIELVDVDLSQSALDLLDAGKMTKPPPRTWLWEPYVPDKQMTLVSGREGIGKGMFCAHLAVEYTRNHGRDVLWLTAEDDPNDDVWPRLMAAGFDLDGPGRIQFANPEEKLALPQQMRRIDGTLELRGDYGLVILDPGKGFFYGPDGESFNANDEMHVRHALRAVMLLAKRHQCAVVFVIHHRKDSSGGFADRTSGSAAWRQLPRHCIDFARASDEMDAQCAFGVTKTNNGTRGHVRTYKIEPVEEWDTARFVLGPPTSHGSLDAWAKAQREEETGRTIEMDHLPVMLDTIGAQGWETGQHVTKDALMGLAGGLTDREKREVMKQLRSDGYLKGSGLGMTWCWPTTEGGE